MTEQNYAFIKNNNVINIAVFDNPNQEIFYIFKEQYGLDYIILATEKAMVGSTYDGEKFWLPKPYPSWIKNEDLNEWVSPIPYPNDNQRYRWNEETLNWEEIQVSE